MDLYIGNCTKQVQTFTFRLPETMRLVTQTIAIGSQIKVAGNLSSSDIDAIIKHHARYGMIDVKEIDRTKPFVGTCYSDRSIPISAIERGVAHNTDVLVERGKEIRKATAVTINDEYEKNLSDKVGRDASLKELTVTMQEEEPRGGYRGDTAPVGEGYRVNRHQEHRGNRAQRRQARRNG